MALSSMRTGKRTWLEAIVPAILLVVALTFACGIPQLSYAAEGQLTAGSAVEVSQQAAKSTPTIKYATTATSKWGWKSNGATSKVAKSSQIKGLRMKVKSSLSGSVQYQVYIQGYGWQTVRANGKIAGQTGGQAKRIEAVRIALTGQLAANYDVRYRVLTSSGKWLAWKKNGAMAGKSGVKLRGIKVKLVKKSAASTVADVGLVGVRYRAKMEGSSSWQLWKQNYLAAGKAGKTKRIQNIAISLSKGSYSGSIKYRVRRANSKWKAWKTNGKPVGNLSNIEAIQIKLTGNIAKDYDVVYRTYVSGVGWQSRVLNGATAGTAKGRRIEAIQIKLVKKSARSGWVGSGRDWSYYRNGKPVASQWVKTKESPINVLTRASHKYWIDASGKLAVKRIINPKATADAKAGFMAYATKWGYIATNVTIEVGGTWYTANSAGKLTLAGSTSALIEKYVKWAISIANDDSHGYSQDLYARWGHPDYDCSSLVVSAVRAAGLNAGNASWTGNMKSELTKHGFVWHSGTKGLRRGDILLVHNSSRQHTEIYIGNSMTVGAHIAETGGIYGVGGDQTGHEIDVGKYYNIWEGYLRFKG